ncbi:MAG TPA: PQQ-binding-like beta-propeller repeat protein, partial [Pirellulaceae bacterium]|nr:PQQ-binding-like beta-propeller repeat protein [Pirellulaceae bacterium]
TAAEAALAAYAAAPNAANIDRHESENVLSFWQAVAPHTGRRPLAGRTLVATGSHGLVLEFSADGRTEWRQPIRAWSAEPLTGGGTLLAVFEEQRIVELNRTGEIVWEFSGIAATRAKPLPDGRILATDFSAARIVEIDRQKNVAWSLATPEGAFDVERTAHGHTFYGCANLIREVTPDGRVVGQWPVSGRLNGLQVLADGRMLIANFGGNEVALLNRDGSVAWRLAESQPSDAFQSSDGRLLVTTAKRCAEFDDKREFVREWTPARYGTARR